jgi:hypothetical protein
MQRHASIPNCAKLWRSIAKAAKPANLALSKTVNGRILDAAIGEDYVL